MRGHNRPMDLRWWVNGSHMSDPAQGTPRAPAGRLPLGARRPAVRDCGDAVKVHVIHENPDWYGPLATAFDAEGVPHEEWLLDGGLLDLGSAPPTGVFWSRMSASAHTRGHLLAKDFTRGVLCWLESYGRRVVNGRGVLELEMSKMDQFTALRAAGFDVPRTVAVAGRSDLVPAAGKLRVPFISKHNQGGKGLGVRRFDSHEEFTAHVLSAGYAAPVDGITLLQEYVQAAQPFITRVEIVGGEFVYAITADTARGGFELCPADACASASRQARRRRRCHGRALGPDRGRPAGARPVRAARGIRSPDRRRVPELRPRARHRDRRFRVHRVGRRRLVTYDVNTTTNYNAAIEAAAPRPATAAGREVPWAPAGRAGREGIRADALRLLDAGIWRLAAQRA